jgi:hypothetical protein
MDWIESVAAWAVVSSNYLGIRHLPACATG